MKTLPPPLGHARPLQPLAPRAPAPSAPAPSAPERPPFPLATQGPGALRVAMGFPRLLAPAAASLLGVAMGLQLFGAANPAPRTAPVSAHTLSLVLPRQTGAPLSTLTLRPEDFKRADPVSRALDAVQARLMDLATTRLATLQGALRQVYGGTLGSTTLHFCRGLWRLQVRP